jgi:hypothetical protein
MISIFKTYNVDKIALTEDEWALIENSRHRPFWR